MAEADSTEASDATDPRPDDEYECKICYNFFDLERRSPKLLSCSHTFCQECLDTLHAREGRGWRIGCPVCRHRTPVPDYRVRNISTNTALTAALRRQQPADGASSTRTHAETQTETGPSVSSANPRDTDDDCESCKHVAFALSCVCAIFSFLAMVVLLFLGLIFVHNFNHIASPVGLVCLFVASVLALFSLILTWLICMLKYRPDAEASSFSSLTSNVM
ncbi:RING finger protein 224-like [Salarias fasciatus]|uniref:RING finger protein 224-like n=1 Tax=Salarias fasciatus TaxID=181472 RepID=UPI001176F1D6|nr:RING finger protein 224-like [Salarias fasciatus]